MIYHLWGYWQGIISSEKIKVKQSALAGKLVLITNGKSYMSFLLVPKSVTLNDNEQSNNGVKAVTMRYFTEFGSLQAHYVKVVEDTPTLSVAEM